MSTKRSFCQRKTEGGLEKGLANPWSRKKITKKAHTGCGQETIWEIPYKILAGTISEDTPITLKAACYVRVAVLSLSIWINKNLSDAKTAARQAADAAALARDHAESANQTAVKTASNVSAAIEGLKVQLDNLRCHKVAASECLPQSKQN
jgi:hypothetical protein